MLKFRSDVLALLTSLAACGQTPNVAVTGQPAQASVALEIEGNRPFIELAFHLQDGSTRTGRFLVDTGGGAFLLTERFAREVGVTWGIAEHAEGHQMAAVTNPVSASIGGLPIDLDPTHEVVLLGTSNVLPAAAPGHADGVLPGHVLARYHVVFDYPRATFTIARAGVLSPVGKKVPMPVSKDSGFATTEIAVDGHTLRLLVDTGASFTMISEAVLKAWVGNHPEWPIHEGAFGGATTLGGQTLETISVPSADWAGFVLRDVGMTSQSEGVFETRMSSMTATPIVGSLAENVLDQFRVDLDYPNETLYLSR